MLVRLKLGEQENSFNVSKPYASPYYPQLIPHRSVYYLVVEVISQDPTDYVEADIGPCMTKVRTVIHCWSATVPMIK